MKAALCGAAIPCLSDHVLRVERLVEFFLGEKAFLKNDVINGPVGLKGFLGDLAAGLVADDGVEGGHDADAVLDHLVAAVLVDCDAFHTLLSEGVHSVGQPGDALHN